MALLVTTSETSGIDRYSQELARRIRVPILETRRYGSLRDSVTLLYRLSKVSPPIHFPSQHFARYGIFLRKPFIITVHDLVRICFPFSREGVRDRAGLKLDVLGLKRAEHIIAVSACTKADLVKRLGISEEKITVVYNGVDRRLFRPVPGKDLGFPFVLYVGTDRPRKNLSVLLEALAILKKGGGTLSGLKLVKAGNSGRSDSFRQSTISEMRRLGLDDEVVFVEHVPDEELPGYYCSALALVMPSLYEGFGLPIVEAMACGCPVICSNNSSLPEVAGEASLFFAPDDSNRLACLIQQLASEPSLRDELVQKGFRRVQQFSWEKAAHETLKVYGKVEEQLGLRRETAKVSLPQTLALPNVSETRLTRQISSEKRVPPVSPMRHYRASRNHYSKSDNNYN